MRRSASISVVVVGLGVLAGGLAPAWAVDGAGSRGYHFLNLGSSPRAEALAGAGTAMADGVDAMAYNPARLAGFPSRQFSASFFTWLDDVQSGYVGGVQPLPGRGALGIAFRSLSVGEFGNVPGEADINESDFAGAVGCAYPVLGGLDAGVALKYIRSSLADETATGWAVDAGLNYRYVDGWNVAAAIRNSGPAFGYGDGADEQLPTQGAFGLSGVIRELHFGYEVLWENGPGWGSVLGAEYWVMDRLALRLGSRFGLETENAAVEPWAMGLGIRARSDLEVEYSFRDGTFDPSHRVGVRWTLGRPLDDGEEELARSPREFYLDALNLALEQSLATFPRDVSDTVVVRASADHDANRMISNEIADRLRGWGLQVELQDPVPALPDTLDPEVAAEAAKALADAGIGSGSVLPALEFDVLSSDYTILQSKRARWIGPRSIERKADVHLALRLQEPDSDEPIWTSSGAGEQTESVSSDRVPRSGGYPKSGGTSVSSQSRFQPLVEPAIVGGIVAGLAVIFFSNRDVGN